MDNNMGQSKMVPGSVLISFPRMDEQTGLAQTHRTGKQSQMGQRPKPSLSSFALGGQAGLIGASVPIGPPLLSFSWPPPAGKTFQMLYF